MGAGNFAALEKKYKNQGVQYILAKYRQRHSSSNANEQINKLKEQANKYQKNDVEFINQQRNNLKNKFEQAKNQANAKNPKSIEEAEARTKQTVQQFSGYNDELKRIQEVEKQLKKSYEKERLNMQEKFKQQLKSHQKSATGLTSLKQYDDATQNYKKALEKQCIDKYPNRKSEDNQSGLSQKLSWDNFKKSFEAILDREKFKNEVEEAAQRVNGNITPGGTAICC